MASQTSLEDFYVDDLLYGADSVVDATEKQTHLVAALSRDGFELRNWASNCPTLIENVPPKYRELKYPRDTTLIEVNHPTS